MSIEELFSGNKQFSIPVYQRPYSWSVDEAVQLLDDVSLAAGIEDGSPQEDDYFLGAMVLFDSGLEQSEGQSHHTGEFEIVDGQQRLVTLTILLAALRDLEPMRDAPLARRIAELIAWDTGSAPGIQPRLLLSGSNREFFERYVQQPGATQIAVDESDFFSAGQKAVLQARVRLVDELKKLTDSERSALAQYLCGQCHCVVMQSHDIDRAHRIFMVLNDRGRPLQRKDILKAEILKSLAPADREPALQIWAGVEARLGDGMEAFFSQLRAAYGHGRMQVIAGVRRLVREAGGARPFVHDVLAPLADAYATILSAQRPDVEMHDEIRRPLVALLRLKGREWMPAAMHIVARVGEPARAASYLREIERAAFLVRLNCLGAGKRLTRFAKITEAARAADLPSPNDLYEPTREELRTIAFNLRDLHARSVPTCKALLLRLNDEMQSSALLADPAGLTVEHILPQRPKAASTWKEWFPDGTVRVALTGSLGNLVLVSPEANERARNHEFQTKKEIYKDFLPRGGQLKITESVLSSELWQANEVLAREDRLIGLINGLWRLELETGQLGDRAA